MTPTRRWTAGLTSFLAAVICSPLAARDANANGRFPAAQYVIVGPGPASDRIVLRTTFGLIVSTDGGTTFHWSCEQALEYSGAWDPAVAIGAGGAILTALPDGIVATVDGCGYTRVPGVGAVPIADLANDPTGKRIIAIEAMPGARNHVLSSQDSGGSFAELGTGVSGLRFETIEAAPSLPSRVYVTAVDEASSSPSLLRSDDGGVTLTVVRTDFLGGTDAFVSGIDARNAGRVWLRSNAASGTSLLRTDDGGDSMSIAFRSAGSMQGFAVSDDGARVWAGGPDDGLFRSDDGGATFHRVSDLAVTCLRYHAGVLYVCSDWARDGVALSRWDDGAAQPHELLRFTDVLGPFDCAPGTVEHDTCGARWPTQRALFIVPDAGAATEGGVPDGGGIDAMDARATVDVPDADSAAIDASDELATPGNEVRVGGGCTSAPGGSSAWPSSIVALMAGVILRWRRGARRSRGATLRAQLRR